MKHCQTPGCGAAAAKASKRTVPLIAAILLLTVAVIAVGEMLARSAMPYWEESGEPFAMLALIKQRAESGPTPVATPVPVPTEAPTPALCQTADGLLLDRTEGGYAVAGYQGDDGEVTIPAEVDGVPVVGILDHAFAEYSSLTGITLPESITFIGEYAFFECYNLTRITIPAGVVSIGDAAFARIASDAELTVAPGNGVFAVEDGILFDKQQQKLLWYRPDRPDTGYRIPEGITAVGAYAFYHCGNLAGITIPESVTSIGDGAFVYTAFAAELTVAPGNTVFAVERGMLFDKRQKRLLWSHRERADSSLPEGITSIGAYACADCDDLTAVTIPEGVVSVGDHAFDNCDHLVSVTIPGSVASIGDYAFAYCGSLTGIAIPEGVASVGELAFFGCGKLTDISISASVATIGDGAFSYIADDAEITVAPGNTVFSVKDGALFDDRQHKLLQYRCTQRRTNYRIPYGVASVGDYAFFSHKNLTGVTIPESVTSIGHNAFAGCTNLTLKVPKGSYAEQYAIMNHLSCTTY